MAPQAPRKSLHWLAWLVLGPVTSPLIPIILRSVRARRIWLPATCIAAIVLFWMFGPRILSAEMTYLRAHWPRH